MCELLRVMYMLRIVVCSIHIHALIVVRFNAVHVNSCLQLRPKDVFTSWGGETAVCMHYFSYGAE